MKYVIFEGNGLVHPVIFEEHTTHSQITVAGTKPVAAGFVSFDKYGWPHCNGKSDSLKLKCRGEMDEDIIRRAYNNCGTYMFIADFYTEETYNPKDK
jgi:hypothetical protein